MEAFRCWTPTGEFESFQQWRNNGDLCKSRGPGEDPACGTAFAQ